MTVIPSPASGGETLTSGENASIPARPDLVNLTIDGVGVSVPKGTLVIRAAEEIGIEIPRFCDHPLLEPVGACRQCMVEVATPGPDGSLRPMPKPMTSCTTTVSEGMQVKSQLTSEVADKAQTGLLELLLDQPPAGLPGLRQRAASARSRTRRCRRGRPRPASTTSSAPTPSRSTSPRRCCWIVSAVFCALAARASPTRSPATRSSRWLSVAHCSRSASTRRSRSSPTSPATPSRSARSAR